MATTTSLPTRSTSGTPPQRRRPMLVIVLATLGVLAGVLSALGGALGSAPADGPPGGPPPRIIDSVGRVDGSTALIALLARGNTISAYVCEGESATGERFSGTLLGDRAVLHSAGGAELFVDVADGGATGTFTPAGATAARAFRTVPSTGTAGWYTAEAGAGDGAMTANWVVLADGTQTGVKNIHKRRHRADHLHVRPSGVSPKVDGTTLQPDEDGPVRETADATPSDDGSGSLLDEGIQCVKLVNGVCAVRGSVDPVELDGDTAVRPVRVVADEPLPIPSDGSQSLAPA
jgi:hypothetical protein